MSLDQILEELRGLQPQHYFNLDVAIMDEMFGLAVPQLQSDDTRVLIWWNGGVGYRIPRLFTDDIKEAFSLMPKNTDYGYKMEQGRHYAWCSGDVAGDLAGNLKEPTVAVRHGITAPLAVCLAALWARKKMKDGGSL